MCTCISYSTCTCMSVYMYTLYPTPPHPTPPHPTPPHPTPPHPTPPHHTPPHPTFKFKCMCISHIPVYTKLGHVHCTVRLCTCISTPDMDIHVYNIYTHSLSPDVHHGSHQSTVRQTLSQPSHDSVRGALATVVLPPVATRSAHVAQSRHGGKHKETGAQELGQAPADEVEVEHLVLVPGWLLIGCHVGPVQEGCAVPGRRHHAVRCLLRRLSKCSSAGGGEIV